ncbi:MAG TPA: CAP domain-containing protein [Isosphaeraceae bacterium]|jgi:uncharacterized protein YkwD|nr:CAP domain-containing protein [Isosphaeraceae bacterium]
MRLEVHRLVWVGSLAAIVALGGDDPAARDSTRPNSKGAAKPDPVVAEVLKLHNRERAKAKLPPLTLEPKLTDAAKRHALDMAEHDTMSHEGSDGSNPQQRIEAAGYKGRGTGENVAFGARTPAAVVQGWMDSPPHKKNILGDYQDVGIAVAKSDDGTPYWCIDFGKPWPKVNPDKQVRLAIEVLNDEREKADLPALKVNAKLARVAEDIAARLAKDAKDEKDARADLGGATKEVEKAGYRFERIGLSAASGLADAEAVVKGWLKDEGTKKNLLGDFSEVGVGMATTDEGVPWWCLILAKPL